MTSHDEKNGRSRTNTARRGAKDPNERSWLRLESLVERTVHAPNRLQSEASPKPEDIRSQILAALTRLASEPTAAVSETFPSPSPKARNTPAKAKTREKITAGPWPRARDRMRLG